MKPISFSRNSFAVQRFFHGIDVPYFDMVTFSLRPWTVDFTFSGRGSIGRSVEFSLVPLRGLFQECHQSVVSTGTSITGLAIQQDRKK